MPRNSGRLTAAYHLGRLANQFNWHAQRVLFGRRRKDRTQLDEVLAESASASRRLSGKSLEQLERVVSDIRDDIVGWLECAAAAEEVVDCFSDGWPADDMTAEERRKELFRVRVGPLLVTWTQRCVPTLSDAEQQACDLGRLVDQIVRRADLYRFVEGCNYIRSGTYSDGEDGTSWGEAGFEVQLVPAAALPVDPACRCALAALLSRSHISADKYEPLLARLSSSKQENVSNTTHQLLEATTQLDQLICEQLDELNSADTNRSTKPTIIAEPGIRRQSRKRAAARDAGEAVHTPPQLARVWGVSTSKVHAFIRSGELKACNIAKSPAGRPRYIIKPAAVADFERTRQAVSDGVKSARKPRQRSNEKVKQFF